MKENSLWNPIFRGKGARKNASFKNVFVCNFFISLRLGHSLTKECPKRRQTKKGSKPNTQVYTKTKKMRYSEEKKREAIKLYMEGNSGREVGRIMGIGPNTCLYLGKKICKRDKT